MVRFRLTLADDERAEADAELGDASVVARLHDLGDVLVRLAALLRDEVG